MKGKTSLLFQQQPISACMRRAHQQRHARNVWYVMTLVLFPLDRCKTQQHCHQMPLPRYSVILHHHQRHGLHEVINALVTAVPVSLPEAQRIGLAAQKHGRAVVIVCPREVAEYYKERLETYDLTISLLLA